MAQVNPSSWLVDKTEQSPILIGVDETNDNTITIEQQGDDTLIWVAPKDVDAFIDALRAAKAVAIGRD